MEKKLTKEEMENLNIDELINNLPKVEPRKSKMPIVVVVLIVITLLLFILATVLSSK